MEGEGSLALWAYYPSSGSSLSHPLPQSLSALFPLSQVDFSLVSVSRLIFSPFRTAIFSESTLNFAPRYRRDTLASDLPVPNFEQVTANR